AGGVVVGLCGALSGPQRRGSTPSDPTSTSGTVVNANVPGKRAPPALVIGVLVRSAGAPGARTDMTGEKTCVFDVAATVIASGAVPGEPMVPIPNSSRSFPAEMTVTTPASRTLWITSSIASFAGSVSGPPPE